MATLTNIKKPEPRIVPSFDKKLGLKTYGAANDYPQRLLDVLGASGAAKLCVKRYYRNIKGQGFKDTILADIEVNTNGDTLADLLDMAAHDYARFEGIAIHVNYSLSGLICDMKLVPFQNCRLSEPDSRGFSPYILVHSDWTGQDTRNGKAVKIDEDHVDRVCVFNPDKNVVMSQIQAEGGIDTYKGQILYVGNEKRNRYPIPRLDVIVTEMSTDEGLANTTYRNVRYNFHPAGLLLMKKARDADNLPTERLLDNGEGVDYNSPEQIRQEAIQEEEEEFDKNMLDMQGDTNLGNFGVVRYGETEDKPEFLSFGGKNYDKDFTASETSNTERIYAQFEQEIYYTIRKGKLGFSSQIAKDAFEYCANNTQAEREFMKREFERIIKNSELVSNPSLVDLSIVPPVYYSKKESE